MANGKYSESFRAKARELTKHEQMHLNAIYSQAEQMYSTLKGNRPDPYCMGIAIDKLRELVDWAERAVRQGAHL